MKNLGPKDRVFKIQIDCSVKPLKINTKYPIPNTQYPIPITQSILTQLGYHFQK